MTKWVIWVAVAAAMGVHTTRASAAVNCEAGPVLKAVSDKMKCDEFINCKNLSFGNLQTPSSIEAATDDVIAKNLYAGISAYREKILSINTMAAQKYAEDHFKQYQKLLIGLREVFQSITVAASAIDYDSSRRRYTCRVQVGFDNSRFAKFADSYGYLVMTADPNVSMVTAITIGDNRDPMPRLLNGAQGVAFNLIKCVNRKRRFVVQPTVGDGFIVSLDDNALITGCSL